MGTSTDHTAGSGGAWKPLKLATNAWLRGVGSGSSNSEANAVRVLARHVPVLGGAGAAASNAVAGRGGIQRLGALLSEVGGTGLADALDSLGLGDLVGLTRFDVLDELVTFIAGDGDDLDSRAARDAACDLLDELFGDADAWTELADTSSLNVTRESMPVLVNTFLVQYVYNRLPVIAERLSRLSDPHAVRDADREMRRLISNLVEVRMPEEPFAVDWKGSEGRQIAEDTVRAAYTALEALDGDAQ